MFCAEIGVFLNCKNCGERCVVRQGTSCYWSFPHQSSSSLSPLSLPPPWNNSTTTATTPTPPAALLTRPPPPELLKLSFPLFLSRLKLNKKYRANPVFPWSQLRGDLSISYARGQREGGDGKGTLTLFTFPHLTHLTY